MNFELSDELSELQSTVRRLAKDKVAPRAREIDLSGEYPEDLFAIFGMPACSVFASRLTTAEPAQAFSG